MNDYELHLGDCLEVMKSFPRGWADCIVTDPPYFLPATHYNTRSATAKSLSDLSILSHYFNDLFAAMRRILKPTGFVYCFCDGQSYPVFYVAAYPHFKRVRPLIWDKGTSINGYSWRHQHELILFCESEESPAIPTGDGDVLKQRAVPIGEREHLAQKPVELLARLIAKSTRQKDIVVDPFMGSCATGLAALSLGRQFVGIEIDPAYHALAQARMEQAAMQPQLFEVTP